MASSHFLAVYGPGVNRLLTKSRQQRESKRTTQMATCTLVITDYSGGRQGEDKDKMTIEGVDMGISISEVKQLISNQRPELKPEKFILYMGKILLEDQKKLQMYNKSKRAKLSLELYDLVEIKVFVKTLQREPTSFSSLGGLDRHYCRPRYFYCFAPSRCTFSCPFFSG